MQHKPVFARAVARLCSHGISHITANEVIARYTFEDIAAAISDMHHDDIKIYKDNYLKKALAGKEIQKDKGGTMGSPLKLSPELGELKQSMPPKPIINKPAPETFRKSLKQIKEGLKNARK